MNILGEEDYVFVNKLNSLITNGNFLENISRFDKNTEESKNSSNYDYNHNDYNNETRYGKLEGELIRKKDMKQKYIKNHHR
ncbi:hypothetical protein PMALA_079440 [Plasmodium malariae]|uniref:Uncharacterized protein n=1 Tax=Plasmodium malariae TaxID=5858 RepID=A0A1A8X704_PLAMA|nr:hypothetical protein PMALA_079440 [Plasmodium malariae]